MTAEPPGNRHEAAAFSLANGTAVEKSKAIRFIKNAIIGNRTNKERYLSLGVTER